MPDPTPGTLNDVLAAFEALGNAWRGDWSDFDGRALKHQINSLVAEARSETPRNYVQLCADLGIDPETQSWEGGW